MASRPGPRAGHTDAEPRAAWWWLGVLVLVGVAIRVPFLDQPMRQDEADSVVLFAMTPVRHILVDTAIPNNHILHNVLVRWAMELFGNHPWVVRLPAFLGGVAVFPLAFLVGRAFYSTAAGLWAAAITAISTPLVLYSTNARGYSLIAAATLGCLLALQRALAGNGWRAWLGFSACAAAGAFVNPSMLYPVGGMVLWALVEILTSSPERASRLWRLSAACATAAILALVAYLPALAVSGWRSVVSNSYVRPMAWSRFLGTLPDFAADMARYVGTGWPLVLQVVIGMGLVGGLAFHARLARHRWPVALVMLAWAVALLLVMRRAPFLRIWLYLLPVFAVVAGAGLAGALARVRPLAAPALAGLLASALAIGGGWQVVSARTPDLIVETGVFREAEGLADLLATLLAPGDVVAARWLSQGPVDYYLRRRGVTASFVAMNDSVAGRLFVVQADDLEDTPASILAWRRLRGVEAARAHQLARFPRSALWLIEPPPASR